MRSLSRVLVAVAVIVFGGASGAFADKIVLANDEWHTSNTGFTNAGVGATNFVLNVAAFFTGGGSGSFLIVSDNFSLDLDQATSFASTLSGAGHTLTDSEDVVGFSFDLPTLQSYDGVFFALPPAIDQNVLISYVNGGGNVYINAGTGVGGAASEAANWNTFLNVFGLNVASSYNGIAGNIPIASAHPILAGVPALYQNNGNTISLVGGNPNAQIIATLGGQGLYGVYEAAAVPEPASFALLGIGLLAAAVRRRSRSAR